MRITLISPVGVVGGAERVLLAGIRSVRDARPDAEFHVLLLGDGPLRGEVERLGASVAVVPLPASLARLGDADTRGPQTVAGLARFGRALVGGAVPTFRFARQLRAALRRSRPDLIHSHGLKTHALAALLRPPGVPVVWHIHDFIGSRPVMVRLLRRLVTPTSHGIAISEAVRRNVGDHLPALTVAVVLNAVDTDHFTPGDGEGAALDRQAGLEPVAAPEVIRVGLVATFARWKGQDVFLAALAQLIAADRPIRGYVIGGPIYSRPGSQWQPNELQDRARALGLAQHVGFVSFQADPLVVYRALDIVVHASTSPEPFGLTIGEAMACGRPVVVADAGGATEVMTPDQDGLTHTPGDATGLAAAVARLVGDPDLRGRLGDAARRSALSRLRLDRFGQQVAAVYARALARAGRPG